MHDLELDLTVRGHYIHTTDLNGYFGISKDKAIKPNIQGRYPYSHCECLGHILKSICIFDFAKTTIEERNEHTHKISGKYFYYEPVRIGFCISPEKVESKLIPNSEREKVKYKKYYSVPKIEVWYPGNIPLSWVYKILLFYNFKRPTYEVEEFNTKDDFKKLYNILEDIKNNPPPQTPAYSEDVLKKFYNIYNKDQIKNLLKRRPAFTEDELKELDKFL